MAEVVSYSAHHIEAVILGDDNCPRWRAVGVYGWAAASDKYRTWDLLRSMKVKSDVPFFGDFHEITSLSEKDGGAIRGERQMDAFRCAIDELHDLGFRGSFFTWQRGNSAETMIRERLDRMLACDGWCSLFPYWEVNHLPIDRSDHAPLVLKSGLACRQRMESRLFQFEASWLSREECGEIVSSAWTESLGAPMTSKLALLTERLSFWASATFGNINKRIKEGALSIFIFS